MGMAYRDGTSCRVGDVDGRVKQRHDRDDQARGGEGLQVAGTTYGNAVGVFLTDALGLSLALLEGMLVLELAAHDGGDDDDGGDERCVKR